MQTFINKGNRSTKEGFGDGIVNAATMIPEIVVLGADITASVGLDKFKNKFPKRFFSLGIAEQNCAGVAAGLALAGKIPVFSTYAVFAALRAADQIRVSICYNKLHVIIGGAHAGISVGPDGATHQALEDIAIMRVIPNITILSPCDATQAELAVMAAAKHKKCPIYIRFGREPMPDFTNKKNEFSIGKGQIFIEGKDVTIIATGHLTWEAIQAANNLKNQGISVRVINIHTIKPIDNDIIIKAAKETGAIVTAEEHQINGGLGGCVAEVLVKHYPVPVEFIGMHDRFGESGSAEFLMNKFGMNSNAIEKAVKKVLKRKKSNT